jgi:hypothetical protein
MRVGSEAESDGKIGEVAARVTPLRWARPSWILAAVMTIACSRAAPVGSEPSVSPADARAEPGPTAEPRLPDWLDDPRLRAHLSDEVRPERRPDGVLQPPGDLVVERLVNDAGIEVVAVHGSWVASYDGDGDDVWIDRVGRVDLLVRVSGVVHVATLARQFQERVAADDADDAGAAGVLARPRLVRSQWHGAGAAGPDLVLTMAYHDVWETQCDHGFERRTDVVVCDLEGGALRCARALVELESFDGCGGAESLAHEPGDPEAPCARVRFSATWAADPDALRTRVTNTDDLHCLDPEATGGRGDPRAPRPAIRYDELWSGQGRIAVETVPLDPGSRGSQGSRR